MRSVFYRRDPPCETAPCLLAIGIPARWLALDPSTPFALAADWTRGAMVVALDTRPAVSVARRSSTRRPRRRTVARRSPQRRIPRGGRRHHAARWNPTEPRSSEMPATRRIGGPPGCMAGFHVGGSGPRRQGARFVAPVDDARLSPPILTWTSPAVTARRKALGGIHILATTS